MSKPTKLVVAAFLALCFLGGQASADTDLGYATTDSAWRHHSCRFASSSPRPWTRWEVRSSISCAEGKWAVPGGLAMAMCIAERESGFLATAENPVSSASGIYQMLDSTWASWRFGSLRMFSNQWDLSTNVLNARSNVMVGVQAMHRWGLSAWGGGCG